VRPAKDADAADHKYPASYLDWWRLHAVDPRTGRYLLIRIQTNSGRSLSAVVFDGHRWYGGVLQVEDPWEAATLERVRRGWKLDLNGSPPTVKGSLRLTGRPGVTVGPWRLGLQVTYTNTPPWEHGSLTWSALVPAGRLDGWVEFESLRVDIRGWRGYLDHTWGRMHLYSTAYQHWDFAVTPSAPGRELDSPWARAKARRPGTSQDLDEAERPALAGSPRSCDTARRDHVSPPHRTKRLVHDLQNRARVRRPLPGEGDRDLRPESDHDSAVARRLQVERRIPDAVLDRVRTYSEPSRLHPAHPARGPVARATTSG
jgi:hypothetical protein